jgi:hypothetical protein
MPIVLMILAVLSTECPLSRNQVFTLNRLLADSLGVEVVGVVPRIGGHDSDRAVLERFQQETGAQFPIIGDPTLSRTHSLGATVTPEVFLVDTAGTILYSGAVDDWMVTLGRKRPTPTQHYLRDAIIAYRAGQPITTSHVPAVGCLIE